MEAVFAIFPIIFIVVLVIIIGSHSRTLRRKYKPIKTFYHDGKKYFLYSYEKYGNHGQSVIYELKFENNESQGLFNTIQEVLMYLNLDSFPEDDIFNK